MTAVLASTSASSSSYFGTLDFLDSQSTFDAVFTSPVPLLVTPSAASASVDSLLLLAALIAFIDRCKFQLFVPIFCCDYVGTTNRDSAASLHATILALKRPSMSYRHPTSGHWLHLTPNKLFAAYADLTPLLPNKVSLWGLNLVTQFLDALSPDLQEALQTNSTYSGSLLTAAALLFPLKKGQTTCAPDQIKSSFEKLDYAEVKEWLRMLSGTIVI
jgi:hypothetical protein